MSHYTDRAQLINSEIGADVFEPNMKSKWNGLSGAVFNVVNGVLGQIQLDILATSEFNEATFLSFEPNSDLRNRKDTFSEKVGILLVPLFKEGSDVHEATHEDEDDKVSEVSRVMVILSHPRHQKTTALLVVCGQANVLNEFLATLPKKDLQEIEPWLEPIVLERGQILWEAGDTRPYIYFPTTAIIYLLYETGDGVSTEVGGIGRRGIAGLTSVVGGAEELARAVVEREGSGFRMESGRVKAEFAKGGNFHDLMLCFTQSLINQLSLTAVCNRLHSVEKRLCRWLLRNHDNEQRGIFDATHAQIATILGVRRESISLSVSKLEHQGLINGSRGKIKILDWGGVEAIACECYLTMKTLHDKMISSYRSSRPIE